MAVIEDLLGPLLHEARSARADAGDDRGSGGRFRLAVSQLLDLLAGEDLCRAACPRVLAEGRGRVRLTESQRRARDGDQEQRDRAECEREHGC